MHVYIFDYNTNTILHTEMAFMATNDIVERYLKRHFGLNSDEISFITSKEELQIEELKDL